MLYGIVALYGCVVIMGSFPFVHTYGENILDGIA